MMKKGTLLPDTFTGNLLDELRKRQPGPVSVIGGWRLR